MISMTARARRSIVVAVVLTAFALPTVALAQEAPFTISIEDLVPEVPKSTSFTYELAQDAIFRDLTWTELTGVLEFAELEVEVCAPGGVCVDGSDPDDTILPAGTVTVTVTATISGDAPQNSSGTASGQLAFAAPDAVIEDGELPFTGARLLEMTAWAAALIAVGALVVAVARRRDTEEAMP